MFPSSVKETLLGWKGAFVGKKHWAVWKTRNKIAFDNGVLSLQELKAFFVYLLWLESKLFIKDGRRR